MYNRIFSALLALSLFGISANAQSERKVTPVLELGAGLSVEAYSAFEGCVRGLATEFNFGLDILVDGKWSVMPEIGHNIMLGDAWYALQGYDGLDCDVFSFYNAAVLGRYRLEDGVAVGLGPAIFINEREDTYFIDADPFDPLNSLVKIKPWDLGLRATLTKDYGKHWRIGVLANIGLRNMLCQYPEFGVSGNTHLFSFCLTAGFRL